MIRLETLNIKIITRTISKQLALFYFQFSMNDRGKGFFKTVVIFYGKKVFVKEL